LRASSNALLGEGPFSEDFLPLLMIILSFVSPKNPCAPHPQGPEKVSP
jgi:hypothetical protein